MASQLFTVSKPFSSGKKWCSNKQVIKPANFSFWLTSSVKIIKETWYLTYSITTLQLTLAIHSRWKDFVDNVVVNFK